MISLHPQLARVCARGSLEQDPLVYLGMYHPITRSGTRILSADGMSRMMNVPNTTPNWYCADLTDGTPVSNQEQLGYLHDTECPKTYEPDEHHSFNLHVPISRPRVYASPVLYTQDHELLDLSVDVDRACNVIQEYKDWNIPAIFYIQGFNIRLPVVVICRSVEENQPDKFEFVLLRDYPVFAAWLSQQYYFYFNNDARQEVSSILSHRPKRSISLDDIDRYDINHRRDKFIKPYQNTYQPTPSSMWLKGNENLTEKKEFGSSIFNYHEMTKEFAFSPLASFYSVTRDGDLKEVLFERGALTEEIKAYVVACSRLQEPQLSEVTETFKRKNPSLSNVFQTYKDHVLWERRNNYDGWRISSCDEQNSTHTPHRNESTATKEGNTMHNPLRTREDYVAAATFGLNQQKRIHINSGYFTPSQREGGIFNQQGYDMIGGLFEQNGYVQPTSMNLKEYVDEAIAQRSIIINGQQQNHQQFNNNSHVPQPIRGMSNRPTHQQSEPSQQDIEISNMIMGIGTAPTKQPEDRTNPFDHMGTFEGHGVAPNDHTTLDKEMSDFVLKGVKLKGDGFWVHHETNLPMYDVLPYEQSNTRRTKVSLSNVDLRKLAHIEQYQPYNQSRDACIKLQLVFDDGSAVELQGQTNQQMVDHCGKYSAYIYRNRKEQYYAMKKRQSQTNPPTPIGELDILAIFTGRTSVEDAVANAQETVQKPVPEQKKEKIDLLTMPGSSNSEQKGKQTPPQEPAEKSKPVTSVTFDDLEEVDVAEEQQLPVEKSWQFCGLTVTDDGYTQRIKDIKKSIGSEVDTDIFNGILLAIDEEDFASLPLKSQISAEFSKRIAQCTGKEKHVEVFPWMYMRNDASISINQERKYTLIEFMLLLSKVRQELKKKYPDNTIDLSDARRGLSDVVNGETFDRTYSEIIADSDARDDGLNESAVENAAKLAASPTSIVVPYIVPLPRTKDTPLTIRRLAAAVHLASPITRHFYALDRPSFEGTYKSRYDAIKKSIEDAIADIRKVGDGGHRVIERYEGMAVVSDEWFYNVEHEQGIAGLIYEEWREHFGHTKVFKSFVDFKKTFDDAYEISNAAHVDARLVELNDRVDEAKKKGYKSSSFDMDILAEINSEVIKSRVLKRRTDGAVLIEPDNNKVGLTKHYKESTFKPEEDTFELVLIDPQDLELKLEDTCPSADEMIPIQEEDGSYTLDVAPPTQEVMVIDGELIEDPTAEDESNPFAQYKRVFSTQVVEEEDVLRDIVLPSTNSVACAGFTVVKGKELSPGVLYAAQELQQYIEDTAPMDISEIITHLRLMALSALSNDFQEKDNEYTPLEAAKLCRLLTDSLNEYALRVMGDSTFFIDDILINPNCTDADFISREVNGINLGRDGIDLFKRVLQGIKPIGVENTTGEEETVIGYTEDIMVIKTSAMYSALGIKGVSRHGTLVNRDLCGEYFKAVIAMLNFMYSTTYDTQTPVRLYTGDGARLEIRKRPDGWAVSMG